MSDKSQSYKVMGTLIRVGPVETFGAKNFEVRKIVVETEDKYPQKVELQCCGNNCNVVTDDDEGRKVELEFNLRGREHNGRYYVQLDAWRATWINAPVGGDASQEETPEDEDDGAPASDHAGGGDAEGDDEMSF